MTNVVYPPSAFYFVVSIGANPFAAHVGATFQEVSGLGARVETDVVAEGGVNRFAQPLPKWVKPDNLVLKRGSVKRVSPLVDWVGGVMTGDLNAPIPTRTITLGLFDDAGKAQRVWRFEQAWPIRWEIATLATTKDEIAIEKLELAYTSMLITT